MSRYQHSVYDKTCITKHARNMQSLKMQDQKTYAEQVQNDAYRYILKMLNEIGFEHTKKVLKHHVGETE